MKKIRKILILTASMVFLLLFFVSVQSILAWTGALGHPPGHEFYEEIADYTVKLNTGDTAQQKTGLLTLTASNIGLIVSPGFLGVGTSFPGGRLGLVNSSTHIDINGSGELEFTDTQIGSRSLSDIYDDSSTFLDGGNTADGDRVLGNNTAFALSFIASGENRINIASGGGVGIGTTTTGEKLIIDGALKLGWDGSVCAAGKEGTMRWNATTTTVQYCDGTVWK